MATVLHVLPHRGGGAETYVDVLEAMPGYRHERVALSSGRTAASAALSLPARYVPITRAARRADIVHAHGDLGASLAIPLLRNQPSVVSTQGLHFLRRAEGARRAAAEAALRAVVRSATLTICTSEAEHDEVAEVVGRSALPRLTMIPSGIALPPLASLSERSVIRAELGLRDSDVAALFLGELEARKCPLIAIDAAERAARAGAPIVLLVAGAGPQQAQVDARANDTIRPLGFRRDPSRLLAAADIFILPSTREGLSFAVLEAMANELAMVVSDGPGNPEAVGDAGVVVPVGDVDALAGALQHLGADAGARRALGSAARERVRSTYNARRMVDGVAAAYAAASAAYCA